MNIVKTLTALVLSLLTIITIYTIFILGNISSFFSTENIKQTTSNIDVVHEMEKIQNSTATAGKKAEIADIINTAYNEAETHGISKELVDEIFNSKEVKEFLGEAVGHTTDYAINGKTASEVTSEDFEVLIDNNIDKWIKETNTDISDTKKEVLVIRLKNASRGIIDNLPNTETIDNTIDTNTLHKVQFIFSIGFRIALIIIAAIMLAIITFLKRKENKWLIYIGSIIIVTGLITIATSFIINDIITLSLNNYNLSFMTNAFSQVFSQQILITGAIAIIIAIIIFVAYIFLNKKIQLKTVNQ